MAHTKSGGTSTNGRDSSPKYLGVKRFAGATVRVGDIIVRQRGVKIMPGANVLVGKDHTLYAGAEGIVKFSEKRKERFDRTVRYAKVASVLPIVS